VTLLEFDALLAGADHISLHARATADNRGMIGAREFGLMKRGAFFINTARDVLVDEDALVAALGEGRLGGVALDVATPAPAGQPHRLLAFPTVLLLPHIGGATYETLVRGGRMAAAEIERFAAGRPLVNLANPAALSRAEANP
jgi:D-3-phosphoglycerate dehydrogenase / 2-oxoglutarate reductase